MRILFGTVAAAIALAGCGGGDAPEPAETLSCETVPAEVVTAIAEGGENGTVLQISDAAAYRSPDYEQVYFVAARSDAGGDAEDVGVWATNDLEPIAARTVLAVDGFAQQFTVWPDADATTFEISKADPGVDAARACLEQAAE